MGKQACYLAIDFGTSNVHVTLFDRQTMKTVAGTSRKYCWYTPAANQIELDAEEIWTASETAVAETIRLGGAVEIAAVTFSFFGDNITPVDGKGNALYRMLPGFCGRSYREVETLAREIGAEQYGKITGNTLSTLSSASKILWLKRNCPDVFARSEAFYTNQQYIMHKLGFGDIQDRTMAARKLAYDVQREQWSEPILDVCGMTEEQLGTTIVESQTVVGKIRSYGRVELGGPVPVTIGCHDVSASLLAADVKTDQIGTLGVLMGTYEQIGYFSDEFVTGCNEFGDSLIFSCCYNSPFRGKYTVMDAFPTSGAMLEWYCKNLLADTKADIGQMIAKADLQKESRLFVLPYMENYHGAILGMSMATTLEDIFEALLKSLAYQFVACIDYIKGTTNGVFHNIHFGGGGSRSDKLIGLRADLLNTRMGRMKNIELPSLGSCILASLGNGWSKTVDEAQEQVKNDVVYFEPDCVNGRKQRENYKVYKALSADYLKNY